MSGNETIVVFEHCGDIYEIDHLGIGYDSQWGEYAIYSNGKQIGGFASPAALYLPEHRHPLPHNDFLIELAKDVIGDDEPEEGQ